MTQNQSNQPLFQTPNPEKLKKAAAVDPIHEREGAKEADLVDDSATDASVPSGQETSAEMASSQVTIANLGGH